MVGAVIYVRVGTKEQTENLSLPTQLRACDPIGPYDVLIAGQAKARKMTLVTHNTTEFQRVPGLKVEDWKGATSSPSAASRLQRSQEKPRSEQRRSDCFQKHETTSRF
jgi:hypothetical protein